MATCGWALIGLMRFDGTEFKIVDLGQLPEAWSSSIVQCLSSAREGGLWVGLESSSYGFCDGRTFSFHSRDVWAKVDPSIQVRARRAGKQSRHALARDR